MAPPAYKVAGNGATNTRRQYTPTRKNIMPTIIFDLDGTLADLTHRLHHIKDGNKRWDEFFDACDKDKPIDPICRLLRMVSEHAYRLVIVSARSDVVRGKTIEWLQSNQLPFDQLIMRKAGDYRTDDIVKEEILDRLLAENHDILFAVDDRQRVVDMWRRRGITCLQCNAWEEDKVQSPDT